MNTLRISSSLHAGTVIGTCSTRRLHTYIMWIQEKINFATDHQFSRGKVLQCTFRWQPIKANNHFLMWSITRPSIIISFALSLALTTIVPRIWMLVQFTACDLTEHSTSLTCDDGNSVMSHSVSRKQNTTTTSNYEFDVCLSNAFVYAACTEPSVTQNTTVVTFNLGEVSLGRAWTFVRRCRCFFCFNNKSCIFLFSAFNSLRLYVICSNKDCCVFLFSTLISSMFFWALSCSSLIFHFQCRITKSTSITRVCLPCLTGGTSIISFRCILYWMTFNRSTLPHPTFCVHSLRCKFQNLDHPELSEKHRIPSVDWEVRHPLDTPQY